MEEADRAHGRGSDCVLWGDAGTVKAKLNQYLENGADQVVIQALRADGKPGADYEALASLIG